MTDNAIKLRENAMGSLEQTQSSWAVRLVVFCLLLLSRPLSADDCWREAGFLVRIEFAGSFCIPENCWCGPSVLPNEGAVGNYWIGGRLLTVQTPPWISRLGNERQGSIYFQPNDGPERAGTIVFQVAEFDIISQCSIEVRQAAGPVTIPGPPVLNSPGNASSPGPVISTLAPVMSWNPVNGATSYGLYVRDLVTDKLVYDNDFVPNDTSLSLPRGTLMPGHNYRWNMRARNSAGFGGFSALSYFQVAPAPRLISGTIAPGGAFQFTIVGVTNHACVIEATADLLNWVPVATNLVFSGSITFSATTTTNIVARFYRVAVLQ